MAAINPSQTTTPQTFIPNDESKKNIKKEVASFFKTIDEAKPSRLLKKSIKEQVKGALQVIDPNQNNLEASAQILHQVVSNVSMSIWVLDHDLKNNPTVNSEIDPIVKSIIDPKFTSGTVSQLYTFDSKKREGYINKRNELMHKGIEDETKKLDESTLRKLQEGVKDRKRYLALPEERKKLLDITTLRSGIII